MGSVKDPNDASQNMGLVEIENPFSMRGKTLAEACTNSAFCLERKEDNTYRLKHIHDYFFQMQCQLYCSDRNWCDFVIGTDRGIHIECIYRDKKW